MIRTIIWLLTIAVSLLISLPLLLVVMLLPGPAKRGRICRLSNFLAGAFGRFSLWVCGADVKVSGLENLPEGPALYVSNHQSYFDIALILAKLPPAKGFIAKKEIQRVPVISPWLKSVGCIFIDRTNLREGLKAINEAADNLRSGISMVIYPEGTRSRGPNMGEFRHGALKAALKAGVPIVPIAVDNDYRLFEENNKMTPAKVYLSVLPPVMPAEGQKTAELAEQVQKMIQQELDRIRSNESIV